ncbi:TPA: LOW QUALITY PROTEIN: hypothetical protein N0F65_001368 [Lagenidium giganteum]|uniref:Phosphoribosylanthranilate isomerase n=1 Tax=Lagenidium giganteum TaxID=4803 RepID=A0AAV2Z025_9STRA|nr:TPA: LOW QUALITY PROTEIN: hypothetical protein N0F65_001368 [Lagenidium giganteum]
MDENGSVLLSAREAYGRKTSLSMSQWDRSLAEWTLSVHNGFEIWWLAGMPIMMVFLFTLVSFSLLSGLEKRRWRWPFGSLRIVPQFVWTALLGSTVSFGRDDGAHGISGNMKVRASIAVPRHIAVIMDGNRRYGKVKYGSGLRGHSDGSKTLVAFTDWCIAAGIEALTVYAFSTENWNREQVEVDALMNLFNEFMHQIVPEALKRDIRVRCLVSDGRKFPKHIVEAIDNIERETAHCESFFLNICVSYGARDEIVGACKKIATDVLHGSTNIDDIDEKLVGQKMLTAGLPDPDILLRTSGEVRISNFLLFQIAYSELIFVDKMWPEMTQQDLHDVIIEFNRRKRRFGNKDDVKSEATDAAAHEGESRVSTRSHDAQHKSKDGGASAKPTRSSSNSSGTVAATSSASSKQPPNTKACANCGKDLSRVIRITCAECTRPTIEMCIECFSVGTELKKHKKTHKYMVSDAMTFQVIREQPCVRAGSEADSTSAVNVTNGAAASKDGSAAGNEWTAEEELLLLEGIEMFGMGNWKDIGDHVVTKSEKKCESHYMTAYLSTSDLLPRFVDEPPEVIDAAKDDASAVPTGAGESVGATSSTASVASTGPAATNIPASGSDLAGYMPLRGDFDVEYDNEAELILADMEFSPDDHATERELKLKVLEIYNCKLDERERRKKFVVERGLLDYKRHQQLERRRPKDERELIAQMRPFARFQTPKEHDDFVNGLITAVRLRKQILLLQEYRRNGVRTLAEAELYDVERKKRETEQALQKQRESASYLYESSRPASSGRERANRWINRDRTPDAANGDGSHDKAGGREGSEHSRARGGSAATTPAGPPSFLIDGTPGSHLLTPKEKELCSKLKLLPKHYLVIKDALVRESYRLGYLTEQTAKEMVQIDVSKTGQIFDFFVRCGWVKSELTTQKVPSSHNHRPRGVHQLTENGFHQSILQWHQQQHPQPLLLPTPQQQKHRALRDESATDRRRMSILDEITAQRRLDVLAAKAQVLEEQLRNQIAQVEAQYGPALDVLKRLNAPPQNAGWSHMALAAEFKRASPSKGDIAVDLDIEEQVKLYATAGASVISVLTEPKWFKGTLADMQLARATVDSMSARPAILRKDFIIDEYQLLEARAHGADCVLLIVAILNPEQLTKLIESTHKLGMWPLVEVNSVAELDIALKANARLIGVNNRDLRTFKMDLETTVRIADDIRRRGIALGADGVTLLALSGIHTRADVIKFEQCGARGILVGEYLMKSGDVRTNIEKLLANRRASVGGADMQPLVKICGIAKLEYAMAALRGGANLIGLIFVEKSPRLVDVAEAKRIVEAVRKYGEREGPILPDALRSAAVNEAKTTPEWFQRNAAVLRAVTARAPLVVGVFANHSAEEINKIATEVGLDIVQLHGDEGFDICKEITLPTVRVFHLPDTLNTDSVDAEAILQHVRGHLANFLLLDTTVKGQQGGTGVTFDWKIAALFNQARLPCLMAGGLTAENVTKAISIAHPLGVDVSSGVEQSPGVKDLSKVALFLKMTKDVFAFANTTIDETPMAEAKVATRKRKRLSPANVCFDDQDSPPLTAASSTKQHARLCALFASDKDTVHRDEGAGNAAPRTLKIMYWNRTDECLARKWDHLDSIDAREVSREELILQTTLADAHTVLEPNWFPYDTPVGIEHWTLWSRATLSDAQVEAFVTKWIQQHAPHILCWNYDENPSKSIDVFHVHVYLQVRPGDQVLR